MLNAQVNSTRPATSSGRVGVTRKEKTVFSALIAPVGAASFLKEGYVVSGSANASLYTERFNGLLKNGKLNCVQYKLGISKYKFLFLLFFVLSCKQVKVKYPHAEISKEDISYIEKKISMLEERIEKLEIVIEKQKDN